MIILGIETSCDETALSLIRANDREIEVLADKTLSQIALHQQYGGVFPNLAKREHLKNLPAMLGPLLKEAGLSEEKPRIDAIAVTVGPGLEPCLWTGITFAQALAEKWKVSVIRVNHMEGHIFSALMRRKDTTNYHLLTTNYPSLALLISGGHTELVLIKKPREYEIVGQTRDDAVGEAFDKVARLLGLPYPGGPEISRLAEIARQKGSIFTSAEESGRLNLSLPRPMLHSKDLDFSFSGLKTAVLYLIKKLPELTEEMKKKIALEFEDAVTEVLVTKTRRAIETYGAQALLIGGGVIANTHIRRSFEDLAHKYGRAYMLKGKFLYIPEKNLTTDNALMIAVAGFFNRALAITEATGLQNLKAEGTLRL